VGHGGDARRAGRRRGHGRPNLGSAALTAAVSLLALSSASFAMAAGHLEPAELGVGWSLVALLHVIAAVRLRARPSYAAPLLAVAVPVAGLAMLPPLLLADEPLLTYAAGAWIGLATWLLWLGPQRRAPRPGGTAEPPGPLAPHGAALGHRPAAALLCRPALHPLTSSRRLAGHHSGDPGLACFDLTHAPRLRRSALFQRWSLPGTRPATAAVWLRRSWR